MESLPRTPVKNKIIQLICMYSGKPINYESVMLFIPLCFLVCLLKFKLCLFGF